MLVGQKKEEAAPEMAFATVGVIPHPKLQGQAIGVIQTGMTLRDYFAACAISNLCLLGHVDSLMEYEKAAQTAYKFADAMLLERAGKEVQNG